MLSTVSKALWVFSVVLEFSKGAFWFLICVPGSKFSICICTDDGERTAGRDHVALEDEPLDPTAAGAAQTPLTLLNFLTHKLYW